MNDSIASTTDHYAKSLASVEKTIAKYDRCSDAEKAALARDFDALRSMAQKLVAGQVDIVVFGEISTGKSAMINALVGAAVAEVDVQGGWTKEIWHVAWQGCAYKVPGLAGSQVLLIDTPGLNEVGGAERAVMAREAAERADMILFVTDSDLTETEYSALVTLAAVHKPILLVLNKIDLYSPEQRARLKEVLLDRTKGLIPPEHFVMTSADPREVEYVIESPDGKTRSEWRKPQPQTGELKEKILEVLDRDGLALLALNAAMYAADKSDRIASLRVKLRNTRAQQIIWSYAGIKALAVALNPVPVVDVLGGTGVDIAMVGTLAHIYGLEMSWNHARSLVQSIAGAAGFVVAGELTTTLLSSFFKALTVGYGTVLTAIPQGAAAGFGSYIVGHAAQYYFEHGSSWGGESPKSVVRRILDETDKQSVIQSLKEEIKRKIQKNPHAGK